MNNKKTELRFFDITEHEKEQEYLRKRHKEGWKLIHVSFPGIYRFEKCEPEDVVYQLDYNQEGLSHKAEYLQMFEDCGWEYLLEFMGYTYFRKPVSEMKEEEGIFCDDSSRLDMIERVFKGRMIPLLVIFACVIVPQLFLQLSMEHTANHVLAVLYIILFVLYVSIFVKYANYYRKLKKNV